MLRQRSEVPAFDTVDSDVLLAGTGTTYVFPPDSGAASARDFSVTVVSGGQLLEVEVAGITNNLSGGCYARGSAVLGIDAP